MSSHHNPAVSTRSQGHGTAQPRCTPGSESEFDGPHEELARANADLASANEALRRSQEQQRFLFDAIPYPVWVFDWETLAIRDVNQSAIASYGYSREEFSSLTIKDLRPSEDVPALLEHIRNSPDGNTGIWRLRKKNGTLMNVEVTTGVVQFGHREARLAVATARGEFEHLDQRRDEAAS